MDQKDKSKKNNINMNDGDDWLKGIKTSKADDFWMINTLLNIYRFDFIVLEYLL